MRLLPSGTATTTEQRSNRLNVQLDETEVRQPAMRLKRSQAIVRPIRGPGVFGGRVQCVNLVSRWHQPACLRLWC